MRDFLKHKWFIALYFIGIALTAVLVILTLGSGEKYKFEVKDSIQFAHPWTYDFLDGTTGVTELPAELPASKSDRLILKNTLPELNETETFIFRARHTKIRVYLEDEIIYDQLEDTSHPDTWFPMEGIVYHEIKLTPEDSRKTITVESVCNIERYLTKPGAVYLGDRGSFFINLIRTRLRTILCAFTLFILALALLVIWFVFTCVLKMPFNEGLYLSLFTFAIGIWVFTETQCLQFLP